MDEYEWYDDEPYYPERPYVEEPYVIVQRQSAGVGPLFLGLALGAGLALLLAPQSGEETRRRLAASARRAQDAAQDLVEDLSGTVADKLDQARDAIEEKLEATMDAVDDKKRRMSNAVGVGRAEARRARGELEARIAESKAAYKDI